MTKYRDEDKKQAASQIRSHLKGGLTYHQAAKRVVSDGSPIALLSLRRMAYDMAVQEGFYTPKGIQHPTDTEHGSLLERCAARLRSQGYAVVHEQNEIRRFVESRGSKGTPDLVATKASEIMLVEVVERPKASASFVDQLERFSKVGSVLIVLPINTSRVQVWGTQDLRETSSH